MTRAKGLAKHLRRLRQLSQIARDPEVSAAVYEGADIIRAEAFRSISAGSVSGAGHVPSAPGEPPMRDSGNLQSHLVTAPTGPLTAEVRSEAEYAAALEFGGSKVAARPYLRPARDKTAPEVQRNFSRAVRRAVKRSGK